MITRYTHENIFFSLTLTNKLLEIIEDSTKGLKETFLESPKEFLKLSCKVYL